MNPSIRFAASTVVLLLLSYDGAIAQDPPPAVAARSYSGWSTTASSNAVRSVPQESSVRNSGSEPVQRVFYQTQASLSDGLPSLPPGPAPQAGGFSGAGSQLPNLPSLNYGDIPASAPSLPRNPAGGLPTLPQRQVLPNSAPVSPSATATPNRPLAAQPVGYPQPPAAAASGQAGNDLRAIGASDAANRPNGERQILPQQVTSGLPYVTPPPRTGRYATSPYVGPRYQNAAYQRSIPAQTVAAQTGPAVPTTAQANAGQPAAVLPQYQNVTGIYPTAYQQCAPAPSFPTNGAVPGTYVPPTYTPNLAPNLYSANNSGYSPLFSLGQENYNVLLGRGIIGQPTVYVPGQPFRNFFRYISP